MEGIISVGKILNFHGIAGIAKVGYSNIDIIKGLKKIYLSSTENNEKKEQFTVTSVNFHKNFALIKFKEINSINELMPYKGSFIYINKKQAEDSLDEDEFLIEDLIGLNAFDNNDDLIGVIVDVKTSNGNDILCVKSSSLDEDGREILIPFAREIVPVVDITKKKVVIKPIEGLL